jgi:hypothetical protein
MSGDSLPSPKRGGVGKHRAGPQCLWSRSRLPHTRALSTRPCGPAQRVVPSNPPRPRGRAENSRGSAGLPDSLALLRRSRRPLGALALPSGPGGRLGPGRKLTMRPSGVNCDEVAVPQCFSWIHAGRGYVAMREKRRRVTNKNRASTRDRRQRPIGRINPSTGDRRRPASAGPPRPGGRRRRAPACPTRRFAARSGGAPPSPSRGPGAPSGYGSR